MTNSETYHDEDLPDVLRNISKTGDLSTPEHYFDALDGRVFSKLDNAHLDLPKAHTNEFDVPSGYFESLVVNIAQKKEVSGLDVPEAFFEKQAMQIAAKATVRKPKSARGKIYYIIGLSAAAAAVLVLALFVLKPKTSNEPSFAELWNNEPLSEEELDLVIDDDDEEILYTIYLDEVDALLNDTLGHDSIPVKKQTLELDPKTGLPIKKQDKIKPKSKDEPLKWDDLETEDLILFLTEDDDTDDDL